MVKAVGESGGCGMLIRQAATGVAIDDFRERLRANPRNYIAQPVIGLSRCPALDPRTGLMAGRHIDLRLQCLRN